MKTSRNLRAEVLALLLGVITSTTYGQLDKGQPETLSPNNASTSGATWATWTAPVGINLGARTGMLQAVLPAASYTGALRNSAIVGYGPANATWAASGQGLFGVGGYAGTLGTATNSGTYATGVDAQAFNSATAYGLNAYARMDAALSGTGGLYYGVYSRATSSQTRATGTLVGVYGQAIPDASVGWQSCFGADFLANGKATSIACGVRAQSVNATAGSTNYGVYASATGAGATNWAYWGVGSGFASGGTWQSSDSRLKTAISPLSGSLSSILKLAPVSYRFDISKHPLFGLPEGEQLGLLAQDLEKIYPMLVMDTHQPDVVDKDGKLLQAGFDLKAVNYSGLIPVLIAGVQEQQAIIEDKQAQIDALSARLSKVEDLLAMNGTMMPTNGTANGKQLTIAPNPFGDRTTITYLVNCDCRVQLDVTTADGKPLTTLVNDKRSLGTYTYEWNTASIAPGTYYCTLIVDGVPTVKQVIKVAR